MTTEIRAAPGPAAATPANRGPDEAGAVATHDVGSERLVLGAMLLNAHAVDEVTDLLTAADMYRPNHATIFTAIINRYAAGEPTDPTAVAAHLLNTGELLRVGGVEYLYDLLAGVPLGAETAWHARRIAEMSGRRRLSLAGITINQVATSPTLSLAEAQDRAGAAFHAAITIDADTAPTRVGDLADRALANIEAAGQRRGLRGITTGVMDLDKLTGGYQAGQLIVIAGRPGMGKSVAALDCARINSVRHGVPVLFTTLEMSKDEVMGRFLSAQTGVPHHRIIDGSPNDSEWTSLARAAAEIQDAPLFVDDQNVNLVQLRSRARRIKERHGLGLVVVDYLQLMPAIVTAGRDRGREREVAELSRGLKLLAKELMCPVIAVSQLNRGPDTRNDKRPSLADLRESGAVENDADVVILLFREDYYDKESPRASEADFIVAKNRHGATDTVTCLAQLHCMRFMDFSPESI